MPERSTAECLHLLSSILNDPKCTEACLEGLEDSELKQLCVQLFAVRNHAAALAQGNLRFVSKERGVTAGALKSLSSNLRHVTWKMHCLVNGDYTRSDPYMGELSVILNVLCDDLHNKSRALDEQLKKYMDLSYMDALTGLLNRRGFHRASQREVQNVLRGEDSACLILADIDHFKLVNDTYGHKSGDMVLKDFADRLQAKLRPRDMCCRYGGEEFLILLPEVGLSTALEIAERQRLYCAEKPFSLEAQEIYVTASFGVSEITLDCGSTEPDVLLESALSRADKALYKAKHQGRNQVCAL